MTKNLQAFPPKKIWQLNEKISNDWMNAEYKNTETNKITWVTL